MATKIFKMSAKAVGNDGLERMVTIVGELEKTNERVSDFEPRIVDGEECFAFVSKKVKKRKLTYALSICHPDDMNIFDEEVAVEIAKRRIKKNPMGWLESESPTNFSDDQVNIILFGELKYAIDHVDDFIEKVC